MARGDFFMGLFSKFSKAGRGAVSAGDEGPSLIDYSGLRVEALTEEHTLLFMGELTIGENGRGTLAMQSGYEGPQLAEDEKLHIFLRGYDQFEKKAIHMECDISGYTSDIYRMDRLKLDGKDNDRAFYRQPVGISGEVRHVDTEGTTQILPCIVENISAGGACFRSEAVYALGSRLLLRSQLLPDSSIALVCSVCRIKGRGDGVFEYGVKFEELDANSEDLIAKAILDLQLKQMRGS